MTLTIDYLSRGSGIVSLALFTMTFALGDPLRKA